jgi:hypothetical protein
MLVRWLQLCKLQQQLGSDQLHQHAALSMPASCCHLDLPVVPAANR